MTDTRLFVTSAADFTNWRPPTLAELSKHWGGWKLDEKTLELLYPAYPGGNCYPIDLERFTHSAGMLDMIMQVAKKTWANNKCLAGLVRALNDILQPQGTLCSCGTNKTLTPAKIKQIVRGRAKRR